MGTRGLYGIRKNGVDKTTYNHYDSYPDGLGRDIIKFAVTHTVEQISTLYDHIEMINEEKLPTSEQIALCKKYANPDFSVSNQSPYDWYCLTRGLQGDLQRAYFMVLNCGITYMMDGRDFILDSLYCEYAYIINLDTGNLEYFMGFQHKPQRGNRYGTETTYKEYYPCKLVAKYPLAEIESIDKVVESMNRKRG